MTLKCSWILQIFAPFLRAAFLFRLSKKVRNIYSVGGFLLILVSQNSGPLCHQSLQLHVAGQVLHHYSNLPRVWLNLFFFVAHCKIVSNLIEAANWF